MYRLLFTLFVISVIAVTPSMADSNVVTLEQLMASIFGGSSSHPESGSEDQTSSSDQIVNDTQNNTNVTNQSDRFTTASITTIRISGLVINNSLWIFGYVSDPGSVQIMRKVESVETIENVTESDGYGLFFSGPYLAGTGTYRAKVGSTRSNRVEAPPIINTTTIPEVVPATPANSDYHMNLTVDPENPHVGGWVFVTGTVVDGLGNPVRGTVDCLIAEDNNSRFEIYDRTKTDFTGGFRFDIQRWDPTILNIKTQYMDENYASQAESGPIEIRYT